MENIWWEFFESVELPWQKPIEELRIKAVINFSSPFGQTKAVILLYSALPSTMGNNVLKTPAHFPAGVNHA